MFYHLKIMLRNLNRGGIYSVINIGGLAVSLVTVIFFTLWVLDEVSYDRFHKRSKDIYRANHYFKETNNYWSVSGAPLAFTAKEEIPEIENACRYYANWGMFYGFDMLKYTAEDEEQVVTDFTCGMVDTTFFSIFDFPVLEGDIRRMLVEPQSIVLTESIAGKLFGNETAIGKTVYDRNRQLYHVTGVLADIPHNSSISFDVLLPMSLYEQTNPGGLTAWGMFDFRTWFLLYPHADAASVEMKLTELHHRNNSRNTESSYHLQSLESVNLYNADGSASAKVQTCRLFTILAFVVILVACVNYVNISTARASRRNREIFVKNIFGARKMNLFFQFLGESALLFLLSLVAATYLLYLFLPVFNHIAAKQLEFNLFTIRTLTVYGLAFLIVILCAGIYPAINLAVKKPLQGIRSKSGNAGLRRVLVVGQFVVATVLVAVTITVILQMDYVRKKDLGYEKENMFYIPMTENLRGHYDAVKSELLQNPSITGVTVTSAPLKGVTSTFSISGIEGSDLEDQRIILLSTDNDFIPTMDVKLAAGRNFDGTPADATSFILNETAVKTLDIIEPVGKKCNVARVEGTIIGVVSDFHFKDLHNSIEPLVIMANEFWKFSFMRTSLNIKTSAHNASQAIAAVEKLWKQYEAELPFTYQFMDDEFDTIYKTDLRTGILFRYFAVIAILISCLGLFGLVTYIAETKTKEIGIRKVLGASVGNIVHMLSKEFLLLIGIAMLIAFPLAYYFMDMMLQDYAYRIPIGWWIFALAGIITIALTLITVGWQAIKAATANPAKAISSSE
jgi:ABC-type antimicrobial peptide transport system permease subunit